MRRPAARTAPPVARLLNVGRPLPVTTGLVLLCGALAVLSLLLGASGFGLPPAMILWQIRLPRTVLALLVGGGLGIAGAALQGGLRNPLADPGLLGISGCAAVGAVIVFYWGLSQRFPPALPVAGLFGAGFGCALLLGFAGRAPSGPSLILAGIALSAIAAALLALALTLAPNPFALAEITFWLMGGLEDRSLMHVALAAPAILVGIALLARVGRGLDALSLAVLVLPISQEPRLGVLTALLGAPFLVTIARKVAP